MIDTGNLPTRRIRYRVDGNGTVECLHPEADAFLRLLQIPLPVSPVDLRGFLADIMNTAHGILGPSVDLTVTIAANQHPADGSLLVDLDAGLNAQRLNSLASTVPEALSIDADVLFHVAPVGYVVEDEFGNILAVNDEICRTFGYTREELRTMCAFHLAGVENRDLVSGNIERILSGEILDHVVVNYRKDGTRIFVELREISFPLPNGRPGILVIAKDITLRKIAERRLSALQLCIFGFTSDSDANIRSLLGICGNLVESETAFYTRLNDTRESSLVAHWCCEPETTLSAEQLLDLCRTAFAEESEVAVRNIDSSECPNKTICKAQDFCTIVHLPIVWNSERVASLTVSFCRQVSLSQEDFDFLQLVAGAMAVEESRHRAHLEIQKSEELHRVIVEMSPSGIGLIGEAGTLRFVNRQFAVLFGFDDPAEMIGVSLIDFIPVENRERIQAVFIPFKESEIRSNAQCVFTRRDGSTFAGDVWAAASKGSAGESTTVVLINDVSLQAETARQLVAAKERAEEADEAKRAFILNVSHEVRAPLHIIVGFTNLIESDLAELLLPRHREYFESIDRAIRRMRRMVEDILNISSIESKTFPVQYEGIDLIEHLGKIVRDMRSIVEEKGLSLSFVNECDSAHVHGDKYCLEQTFINLIDNAAKFTRQGSVTVRLRADDGVPVCEVVDTGIGISEEFLPNLFGYFTQEESQFKRPYQGMGIGMALVKWYLDLNRAVIEVCSTKNIGSTFTVRFPEGSAASGSSQEVKPGPGSRTLERKPAILVVEDDIQSQKFMKVLLSPSYRIHVAGNAEQAWDVLNREEVDLVLSDISLIGSEDGISLTRKIKDNPALRSIPVIMVTAHSSYQTMLESRQAGCSEFVVKPFDPERLRELIARWLNAVRS